MTEHTSESIALWVAAKIREIQNDPGQPEYIRANVTRYQVLPILIDWTAFWGLQVNGEVLVVDTEEGRSPVVEQDPRLIRMALFQGARRYVELQPLVPPRPATAHDCPHCLGAGEINPPGIEPGKIICFCGGLGWLT